MAQREILTQYCFAIHNNSYHYKNVFKLQGFLCCCGSMCRTWATNVIIPTTYTYLCPNGTTLPLLGAEYILNKSQNLRFLEKKFFRLSHYCFPRKTNKKTERKQHKKSPTQKFPDHTMKNKWTKQSKTNTKENKQTIAAEQSSKTTIEKPICQNLWLFFFLHIKAFAFKNKI